MKLVHGTSKTNAEKILKFGLHPGMNSIRMTNNVTNPNAIYFSDAYAFFYALNACEKMKETTAALIEIDTNLIPNSENNMFADELSLIQVYRLKQDKFFNKFKRLPSIPNVTKWFSEHLDRCKSLEFDHNWSMRILGCCCYLGEIPISAITKIVFLKDIDEKWWNEFFDPTITYANYLFLGNKYRVIQKVLLGDVDEAIIIDEDTNSEYIQWLDKKTEPHRELWFKKLK